LPFSPIAQEYSSELLEQLRCPLCGEPARPHVLWFDEYYDEAHYRYQSALEIARNTDLLLVVGTSGATNLPHQIAHSVLAHNGLMVDINTEDNVFGRMAGNHNGFTLRGPSSMLLPELLAWMT